MRVVGVGCRDQPLKDRVLRQLRAKRRIMVKDVKALRVQAAVKFAKRCGDRGKGPLTKIRMPSPVVIKPIKTGSAMLNLEGGKG
jgi:hypothetical protein